MKPEVLAKIMGIAAKTGDRIIVVDSATGAPFALMRLDQYEKLLNQANPQQKPAGDPTLDMGHLTALQGSGMIDPDLAPWKIPEIPLEGKTGDSADSSEAEEDRYYMEPTE